MSSSPRPPSLRERTKLAVQAELLEVGQRLFTEHGYEATTVDDIAAGAGMSKRSFFRYFASKEDLVLGKYDRLGDELAASLASRPSGEPLWAALRRVFDHIVTYAADPETAIRMAEMDRIANSSDALRGAFLERLERAQDALAAVARDRAAAAGAPWLPDDPAPHAIVGAAFACLRAAHMVATTNRTPLGDALDKAMGALATADRDRRSQPTCL